MPIHSSNFCHQLLLFGGAGVLLGAGGLGLSDFAEVVTGVELVGTTELVFGADDFRVEAGADAPAGAEGSSTVGGVVK